MKIIDFLEQSKNYHIMYCDVSQFSRGTYESHLKNVCSLMTTDDKPNMKMLQVPFCVSLWNIDEDDTFHSYSLSDSYKGSFQVSQSKKRFLSSQKFSAPHQHNYYEFIYVYKGRYTHTINDTTYCCNENEFLLLEPGIFHYEAWETDSTILFFCVSRTFFDHLKSHSFFQDMTTPAASDPEASVWFFSYKPVSPDASSSVRLLAEQLVQEIIQGQPGSELISEGLFYRLVAFLIDPCLYSMQKYTVSVKAQERLNMSEELQAYLWSRKGQATRREITEQFNYCADYLNRLLKQQTGMTISKYNQHILLKRAEQLLRETDMSIADIISELGFENRSFFYRLFEKTNGITLSEYRNLEKQKHQMSKSDT